MSDGKSGLQLRSLLKKSGELELSLVDIPTPEPADDEVVVRVEATPINPSDLGLLIGPADMSTAKVSGSADAPVVTAKMPEAALRMMAARLDQSLPVGNEGAGVVIRTGSSDAAKALQERIDRFAAQAPTVGPHAEAAQALIAHARLLHDLLPAVDETLKALIAAPSRQPLEEMRAQFFDRQSAVEATAQRFRLFLYLVSLLLLIMLVRLGLRLRARALALRQRAAFEHVIAQTSTRLISCPPGARTISTLMLGKRLLKALMTSCSTSAKFAV